MRDIVQRQRTGAAGERAGGDTSGSDAESGDDDTDSREHRGQIQGMLIFANAGAALVTTKKGAICSMPERREIVDLIDVSRNAIHQF